MQWLWGWAGLTCRAEWGWLHGAGCLARWAAGRTPQTLAHGMLPLPQAYLREYLDPEAKRARRD